MSPFLAFIFILSSAAQKIAWVNVHKCCKTLVIVLASVHMCWIGKTSYA